MYTCPMCGGRKITGKLTTTGQYCQIGPDTVEVMTLTDQACHTCNGTGKVTMERYVKLTTPPSAAPKSIQK